MKRTIIFLFAFFAFINSANALEVEHHIKTQIGVFDACEETMIYKFNHNNDYDIKTTLETKGTFGVLYPFKAMYHAYGYYDKKKFIPQNYFYETKAFNYRTKEIIYENGIPVTRISTKNDKKKKVGITIDPQYDCSNDLLSVFAELIKKINQNGACNFESYTFNGKKYTEVNVKFLQTEQIKTAIFEGEALKFQYNMKILDGTDAGFLLKKEEPIYLWVAKDKNNDVYFLAKIKIESTPLGSLEAETTKLEVKK